VSPAQHRLGVVVEIGEHDLAPAVLGRDRVDPHGFDAGVNVAALALEPDDPDLGAAVAVGDRAVERRADPFALIVLQHFGRGDRNLDPERAPVQPLRGHFVGEPRDR
jgi:hypothetical protein